VINLDATEVESGPNPEPVSAESSAAGVDPATAARPPDEPVAAVDPAGLESAAMAAAPEPPPPPDPDPGSPSGRVSTAWLPEQLSWTQVSAGIAGVAGGLVVALLLWLFGAFSGGRDTTAELAPRLAAIERQVTELASRPALTSVDPKAIDALNARLGRLEGAQANPPALVIDNIAALSRRTDGIEAGLRDMQARLDRIDTAIGQLKSASEALRASLRSAAAGSDRASRLAVAAGALRGAVERGDPFAAELAVVKPLAADAGALAALEPFAGNGVPGDAALARELAALVKPLLGAQHELRRDGSLLERLQANAENLVRVRRIGEPAGDDREAILARIEQKAAKGDVAGAQVEIAKLPAAAKAALQPWLARVAARDQAIEAGRRLLTEAVAALNASP
jgi:hypothetical protein